MSWSSRAWRPTASARSTGSKSYWLRIEQGERLVLTSRGNRVVVGRFLAPAERRRVGKELEAALAAMRAPRYEHDWDRDGP